MVICCGGPWTLIHAVAELFPNIPRRPQDCPQAVRATARGGAEGASEALEGKAGAGSRMWLGDGGP